MRGSIARRGVGWLLLALALLLVTYVRVRLRQMPLERDEGEYAYIAQQFLQGIPPYKSVYSMKLPGTSLVYAMMMLAFGETAGAIRLGLLVTNLCTTWVVFLLGRKLVDTTLGTVAAVCFAVMSLSPTVLGLAGHASHFVIFFAMVGLLLLIRGIECGRDISIALSGLMFGLAFLMKQPGLLFGLFGLVYLALAKRPGQTLPTQLMRKLGLFVIGLALPFALMCTAFWFAGVFTRFWFWTFSYARQYVSVVSFSDGIRILRAMLREVAVGNLPFWILGLVGMGVLWWDTRLRPYRFFLVGFVLCSLLALWPGMYFRHHYFIFVLPAVALLAGVAVSRSWHLLGRDTSVELLLTPLILILFVWAVVHAVALHGSVWFAPNVTEASRLIYRSSIFADTVDVAAYLQNETEPADKIAVLGSEPQIYFYARRPAATGHIYMYPLMEHHPFASQMQDELISELESAKPKCIVFVNMRLSWLRRPESEAKIFEWWKAYSRTNYLLVRVFTPAKESPKWEPEKFVPYFWDESGLPLQTVLATLQPDTTVPLALHVYKRR